MATNPQKKPKTKAQHRVTERIDDYEKTLATLKPEARKGYRRPGSGKKRR